MLYTIADEHENTWTKVAARLLPSATVAQATLLAARNNSALTTSVRPGRMICYLDTDLVHPSLRNVRPFAASSPWNTPTPR